MRIAVTGGMGFIGSEVLSILDPSDEIIVVDFWGQRLREYEKSRFPILSQLYENLTKASLVLEPSEFLNNFDSIDPSVIIHLGAIVDTMDLCSRDMIEQNVNFTRQLVSAANSQKQWITAPGIIFASSAATYGCDFKNPNNPYGLTKVLGEKAVLSSRGSTINLRFFNVFGEMEHHKGAMASIPFKIAQAYKTGDRFDLHSPNASRDFISVKSVASSVVKCAQKINATSCEVIHLTYDVGTGVSTTFSDIDTFVMHATGNSSSIVREVNIPDSLIGRYQGYTRAGVGALIFNKDEEGTRKGIEDQYGNR